MSDKWECSDPIFADSWNDVQAVMARGAEQYFAAILRHWELAAIKSAPPYFWLGADA